MDTSFPDNQYYNIRNTEIEPEEDASVLFFITGFGPFGRVTENPSSVIIDSLQAEKHTLHNPKLKNVEMLEVVPVAATSARERVNLIVEQMIHRCQVVVPGEDDDGHDRNKPTCTNTHNKEERGRRQQHVVLLHLGVNHRIQRITNNQRNSKNNDVLQQKQQSRPMFQLEENAFNEANFRIPDVNGWKPNHEPINTDKVLAHRLSTDLNVRRIKDSLFQKGYDVCVSSDAGRFLCNYIYWTSLNKLAEEMLRCDTGSNNYHMHALFVHVPDFECISKEIQVSFTLDLLESLSASLHEPKREAQEI